MPDKDRLDYKIACLTIGGPPKDHPYLDKIMKENSAEPIKPSHAPEELVERGYRRILIVGFDTDFIRLLEHAYSKSPVQRLELVFANSTDEAKQQLNACERFNYIISPAIKNDLDKKFVVHGKYGRKTEAVPEIKINGYDIAFAAANKNTTMFLYGTSTDEIKAKQLDAVIVLSPQNMIDEIKNYEARCKDSFLVTRKKKCELLKSFLKKRREPAKPGSKELIHVLG